MNANIDERSLLRFASGEMTEEEETEFIAQNEIAGDSGRWREAVLTVVEHRRVVAALAEFADVNSSPLAATQPVAKTPAPRPNPWLTPLAALTSLAAGLLISLAVEHYFQARRDVGPAPQSSVVQNNTQAGPLAQQPAVQQPVAKNDPPHAVATPVSLQDGRFLGLDPIIPEDQAVSLRQQGYQVEERPTVYIIDGGNGRKWALPTQKATVHYVNR